jgi:hypothetical protein
VGGRATRGEKRSTNKTKVSEKIAAQNIFKERERDSRKEGSRNEINERDVRGFALIAHIVTDVRRKEE